MNLIYFESAALFRRKKVKEAYHQLDSFLENALGERSFSIDEEKFFNVKDASFSNFLERLLDNENRSSSFCAAYSTLWQGAQIQSMLRLLLQKDFAAPTMLELLGMEDMGLKKPVENFDQILVAFRASIASGFVTDIQARTPYDGRVHLNFEEISLELSDEKWGHFKEDFLSLESYCKEFREVSWHTMVQSSDTRVVLYFLYEMFGNHVRTLRDNYDTVTGCLEMNKDWNKVLEIQVENLLQTSSESELTKLLKIGGQFQSKIVEPHLWFKRFLEYSSVKSLTNFRRLYVAPSLLFLLAVRVVFF